MTRAASRCTASVDSSNKVNPLTQFGSCKYNESFDISEAGLNFYMSFYNYNFDLALIVITDYDIFVDTY